MIKKIWWIVPLALALVLLLAVLGSVAWAITGPEPMPEAITALESSNQVHVEEEPWFVFRPLDANPTAGLILYPGARVDPRAYAPAAHALAADGYQVVIVPMPLDFAFFAPDRATSVVGAFPEIERWAIGGHSLGGAMAARFAHLNPGVVQGLVLWASYPAGNNDLSSSEQIVTSVFGTLDGIATEQEIEASQPLLPPDTDWVAIEGGNHAQFGWYGPQSGDNEATISRENQQAQIVTATLALLKRMEQGQD